MKQTECPWLQLFAALLLALTLVTLAALEPLECVSALFEERAS